MQIPSDKDISTLPADSEDAPPECYPDSPALASPELQEVITDEGLPLLMITGIGRTKDGKGKLFPLDLVVRFNRMPTDKEMVAMSQALNMHNLELADQYAKKIRPS
jgi:hypothetical protein